MIARFNSSKKIGPRCGRTLQMIKEKEDVVIIAQTKDIVVIMGRRFYEAVKTWGEVQLNPILELL